MTNLSEVCVSSYVEFSYSLHEGRFSGYKSFWYIVPDDFKPDEKKRFRVYRFDGDGKIAERDGILGMWYDGSLSGINHVELLSNDDYYYLSLRSPYVPAGTAYSFDDYELSHRKNLRYREGQWLCNFDEKKNGLEPKYFLPKEAGAEYCPWRYIEMAVVLLPENVKDLQAKLEKPRDPHAYDMKKLEAVYKHWDDESWFEPKTKDSEPRKFPSLTVEELLGVIGKEEAEKRGYKFEDEEPKAEDKKEEPKAKSKVVYSKETTDKK